MLQAFSVAEQALFVKGLRSASLRRAYAWKTPLNCTCYSYKKSPPRSHIFLARFHIFLLLFNSPPRSSISPTVFSPSAVCYDATTAHIIQQAATAAHLSNMRTYLLHLALTSSVVHLLPGLVPSYYFSSGCARRTSEVAVPGKTHRARPILPVCLGSPSP